MSEGSRHPMDELFLLNDEWGQPELTLEQMLKKSAEARAKVEIPPELEKVLGIEPPETDDPLDRWQEFSLYKAARKYNSTAPLGKRWGMEASAPVSMTDNRPLAIGPGGDDLLKALGEEIEPARPLRKLEFLPDREPVGVLRGKTSDILARVAGHMDGAAGRFVLDLATRARQEGA